MTETTPTGEFVQWCEKDGVRVVTFVEKELGINLDSADLTAELKAAIEGVDKPKLLLNMDGVAYVASKGLGVLIEIHKIVWDVDGIVKISNMSDYVHETFRAAKLHRLADIYVTEEQALQSFADEA